MPPACFRLLRRRARKYTRLSLLRSHMMRVIYNNGYWALTYVYVDDIPHPVPALNCATTSSFLSTI